MKKLIFIMIFPFLVNAQQISVGISNNLLGTEILSSPASPSGVAAGSIWQLIWSPVNSISTINHSDPLAVTGSELLLDQFNGDSETESGFLDAPGGVFLLNAKNYAVGSGFVYARVFDYQGSGSPTVGTWFEETPLFTVNSSNPAPPPSTVSFSGATVMSQQVIPEPGTVALLVMGALGLAMKFRRRRS
jgi:hypothetical protein